MRADFCYLYERDCWILQGILAFFMGELLVSLFVVVSIFLCIFLGKIFIHDILEVNGVNIFLLTGFLANFSTTICCHVCETS